VKLLVASSNPGKLREYQALAAGRIELALFPGFDSLPLFEESAPTFAENAAGKTLHYSRHAELPVIADDSGLVVPALDGAPGVKSARYAGADASDAERVQKLLAELHEKNIRRPPARFICVLALAERGNVRAVFSDFAEGALLDAPRGAGGFGYDPIFFFPPLGKAFAELSSEEKNQHSHRGRAFRKLLRFLSEANKR
jgi:XTP/dITP diphosphohydrolase